MYNIMDYGAKNDAAFNSTAAFQSAVDACAAAGGGYVEIPAGTYMTGTIELRDNVYLNFHPGSLLLGSEDLADYTGTKRGCAWSQRVFEIVKNPSMEHCYALIKGEKVKNAGVIGHGTIDGRRSKTHGYSDKKGRPFLVLLSECENMTVRDLTLKNPGMFTVYSLNSKNMIFDGLKIYSSDSHNGDGIDFDGSTNVTITRCFIDAGDDAISLKVLTPSEPCENFTISDCFLKGNYWGALRLGPEMAGDIRNVTMTNCVIERSNDGIKIQPCEDYVVEDITISNITMRDVHRPIFITQASFPQSAHSHGLRPAPGIIRRLNFSNITAVMEQRPPIYVPEMDEYVDVRSCNYILGQMNGVVEDIRMSNIHMVATGGGTKADAARVDHPELLDYRDLHPESLPTLGNYPSAGLYVKNVANIQLDNCSFTCQTYDERHMVVAENVKGLRVTGSRADNCAGLLRHYHCDDLKLACNDGDIFHLEGEMAKAWDDFRAQSLKSDAQFEETAKAYDKAQTMALVKESDVEKPVVYDYDGGEMYLTMSWFKGNLTIKVNDRTALDWHHPDVYLFHTAIGVDITPYLQLGTNTITVCAEEGTELGSPVQLRKGGK